MTVHRISWGSANSRIPIPHEFEPLVFSPALTSCLPVERKLRVQGLAGEPPQKCIFPFWQCAGQNFLLLFENGILLGMCLTWPANLSKVGLRSAPRIPKLSNCGILVFRSQKTEGSFVIDFCLAMVPTSEPLTTRNPCRNWQSSSVS